jgi:glycerophosphoryl diester phosphodiesterase
MTVGMVMLNTIQLEDETEITAHRGASADAPENTMAAVNAAIKQGADWVEIDVQETADGHVVVFHDSDFKRVAGNELKIWEATLDDLQDLDIGSWFAPEFKDERVPMLEQVLETCQGKIGVNIELKFYGHDVRLEERVIEIVEKYDMESEVVVMSLKLKSVQRLRELKPSWQVGLLTAAAIGSLRRVDADFLAVSAGTATRDFIRETHRSGKKVHVWTINDPIAMSTMIGRAADNLITDKPAVARQVLEERAKLGVPERVLLGVAELFGVKPLFSQQ